MEQGAPVESAEWFVKKKKRPAETSVKARSESFTICRKKKQQNVQQTKKRSRSKAEPVLVSYHPTVSWQLQRKQSSFTFTDLQNHKIQSVECSEETVSTDAGAEWPRSIVTCYRLNITTPADALTALRSADVHWRGAGVQVWLHQKRWRHFSAD